MGFLDYFRGRRRRERALGGLELTVEPSAQAPPLSQATGAESPAVAGGEAAGLGLAQLGQIGAMIAKATREGTIQVHQGELQAAATPGVGLQEEMLGIMRRYGLEPGTATPPQQVDPSQMAAMQQEIIEAIGRQGVDLSAFLGGGNTGSAPTTD